MSLVLPKSRNNGGGSARLASRSGTVHGLAQRHRNASKQNRQALARVTLRGELFERVDLEDAIHFEDNKHTILLNFEEWIKLATDNKITLKNSWLIALIDYFKDLNVIKDGENINFQRALATLDGCVKIYLSRVELVASETGKLLSGLATKTQDDGGDGDDDVDGNGKTKDGENEDENEDGEGEGMSTLNDKKRRKMNRVVELTLVDFETIRVKKLDQELAIDPLFKKALSEFDEGGAKSLLLNTLSIDNGRVVFATAATVGEGKKPGLEDEADEENGPDGKKKADSKAPLAKDTILQLGAHLTGFEEATLCPSLGELKVVLSDINQAKKVLGEVNTRFMDEAGEPTGAEPLPYMLPDFEDDYDNGEDVLNHINESIVRLMIMDNSNHEFNKGSGNSNVEFEPTSNMLDRDLMAYFDRNMKSNWRGPEHWKVQKFREAHNDESGGIKGGIAGDSSAESGNGTGANTGGAGAGAGTGAAKKKEKTQLIINFYEEIDIEELEESVFTPPKNVHLISVKADPSLKTENKYRLPEDIQFNSSRLTTLFLKDRLVVQWQQSKNGQVGKQYGEEEKAFTDENYFADQYERKEAEEVALADAEQNGVDGGEDNPFFDDGGMEFGDINFNDALGNDKADDKKIEQTPEPAVGVRKVRPEYVNFSKIAKRVDVRLLKDNIWESIKADPEEEEKEFKQVIHSIGKKYAPEERKDLSTSFCFICLLHLANEHSLKIEGNDEHDDLKITGFKQEIE